MVFAVKSLQSKVALGASLRSLRESRGWTMRRASTVTRIRETYLSAIEEERFDRLPEEPTRHNLVKCYLNALGGDSQLHALANRELTTLAQATRTVHPPLAYRRRFGPQHIKLFGLAVLLLALLLYLGIEVRALLGPPALTVILPVDGALVYTPTVLVRGEARSAAVVRVNDKLVLKNPEGEFRATVDLARGVNVIVIEARKRYSKPRTIHRTIIFETNN